MSVSGTVAAIVTLAPASALAAPVVSGTDDDVWNLARPQPSYTATTDEPGGALSWLIDDDLATLREGRSPLTIDLPDLAEGAHRLTVFDIGTDGLERTTRTFRIDRTPPSIVLTHPAGGESVTLGGTLTAEYACTGAVSCTGPVPTGSPVPAATAGEAVFTVTALDDAGNGATASAAYSVLAPPTPTPPPDTAADTTPPTATVQATPAPTAPAPTAPPVTTPTTTAASPALVTVNAGVLRPAAGAVVRTRRPVLRWKARRGASLYNVQVFRVRGTATPLKVLSVFPRRNSVRVPARRLSPGKQYIWRVWPYMGKRYVQKPLGISYFRLAG